MAQNWPQNGPTLVRKWTRLAEIWSEIGQHLHWPAKAAQTRSQTGQQKRPALVRSGSERRQSWSQTGTTCSNRLQKGPKHDPQLVPKLFEERSHMPQTCQNMAEKGATHGPTTVQTRSKWPNMVSKPSKPGPKMVKPWPTLAGKWSTLVQSILNLVRHELFNIGPNWSSVVKRV